MPSSRSRERSRVTAARDAVRDLRRMIAETPEVARGAGAAAVSERASRIVELAGSSLFPSLRNELCVLRDSGLQRAGAWPPDREPVYAGTNICGHHPIRADNLIVCRTWMQVIESSSSLLDDVEFALDELERRHAPTRDEPVSSARAPSAGRSPRNGLLEDQAREKVLAAIVGGALMKDLKAVTGFSERAVRSLRETNQKFDEAVSAALERGAAIRSTRRFESRSVVAPDGGTASPGRRRGRAGHDG